MADQKTILNITHYDLDGVGSCLTTKWFYEALGFKVEYLYTSIFEFREKLLKHSIYNKLESYNKIIVTDLDVSENADIIDLPNVVIIDHHKSHVQHKNKYTKALTLIKEYPSNTLLCYKIYKKMFENVTINDNQKMMIAYCNDYDSFAHKYDESIKLNILFWNTQNAFNVFMDTYNKGFIPFNPQQNNIIKLYAEDLKKCIEGLEIYCIKEYVVGDDVYKLYATFAKKHINEIATFLLEQYNAHIAIVVNLDTQHVSIRRCKDCKNLDVSVFAQVYLNGGGHEVSAGGFITEDFLKFTQNLMKVP